MNYAHYMIEDFVADEDFIQWVKNPTEESNAFWQAWLSRNPAMEPVVKEARQIVLMMQFKERKAPDGKFLEIWENIIEADGEKVIRLSPDLITDKRSTRKTISIWYKLAAACMLLGVVITYFLLTDNDMTVVQTAFGESRTLFLPDSTKVTLNSNSTLRYATAFNEKSREVWLDGEAFFSVVHKQDNRNFMVHTQELKVEVLGTKFNVNSRRGKSQVVLEEGKVKLDIPDAAEKSELVMKPGELVEFTQQNKTIDRKNVDVATYSSWRNNQLVFVSTSLAEIVRILEDNYGYEVVFEDEKMKSQTFTGSTSVDSLQELMEKLNRVFDLTIQKEGNKLIIQSNK